MLYRDYEANEWKLMPLVATFFQHEQEHAQYAIEETELRAYEQLGHIEDLEFTEAEFSDEQKERLEEVKDYPESAFGEVIEYVIEGTIPRGSVIERDKELQALGETVDTLVFDNLIGGLF